MPLQSVLNIFNCQGIYSAGILLFARELRKGWKWSSPALLGRKRERTARPEGIRQKKILNIGFDFVNGIKWITCVG